MNINSSKGAEMRGMRIGLMILIHLLSSATRGAFCQQPATVAPPQEIETVSMAFGDDIELKVLIDLVSEELNIRILYDEQILNKKITIRAPGEIPKPSLLGLLQSALKMKELALAEAEVDGWKRIVQTARLPQIAPLGEASRAIQEFGGATAVTQVFVLKNTDPSQVDVSIKPFLTQPGANSLALPELKTLIVTDYAMNMQKVSEVIELIDQPRPDVLIEFIAVRYVDAQTLAQQVSQLLSSRSTGGSAGAGSGSGRNVQSGPVVTADARTNQLLVTGTAESLAEVKRLILSLDVPLQVETKVYQLEFVEAQRVDELMERLLGDDLSASRYKSAIDEAANLLFVTAPQDVHDQVDSLRTLLDVESAQPQSPIRFFKLQNVAAADILETLRAIDDERPDRRRGRLNDRQIRGIRDGFTFPGSNMRPFPGNAIDPGFEFRGQNALPGQLDSVPPPLEDSSALRVPEGEVQITADEGSNTLIVIGPPEAQRAYAALIEELDKRRSQVLIEAKLVIIDASDDFALGVELAGGDRNGLKRLFAFSSFGLSNVDPVTGALSIIPGNGFNGTLVDPDVADVVVRALTNHRRARVMSMPRILVNDNANGLFTSVQEEPFTSVNASNVVATTSFAGFAEAGTTINVTPHIGEGDHLQLEYQIILNSFTGQGGDGVPPPRQTNEIESVVTIPDGHTVIVGGLKLTNGSEEIDSIPFIENIPIIKYLARLDTRNKADTMLFVFLKPVILRDDKFEDLKFLSDRNLVEAKVQGRFPQSQPVLISPTAWGNQRDLDPPLSSEIVAPMSSGEFIQYDTRPDIKP